MSKCNLNSYSVILRSQTIAATIWTYFFKLKKNSIFFETRKSQKNMDFVNFFQNLLTSRSEKNIFVFFGGRTKAWKQLSMNISFVWHRFEVQIPCIWDSRGMSRDWSHGAKLAAKFWDFACSWCMYLVKNNFVERLRALINSTHSGDHCLQVSKNSDFYFLVCRWRAHASKH